MPSDCLETRRGTPYRALHAGLDMDMASNTLGPDELRYWSTGAGAWVQDAEAFDVWVGADSTATLSASFTVVP